MGPEILPKALRTPGKQRIKQLVKPSSLYIYNRILLYIERLLGFTNCFILCFPGVLSALGRISGPITPLQALLHHQHTTTTTSTH